MGVELRPLGVRCNIQCQYCYQNPQRDAGNLNPSYDLDLMKAAIKAEGGPFALFGGEPLLVPERDLEELWSWGLQQFGQNTVQTNGTLINDEHVRMFHAYKVAVGISIDGPGELNDVRWEGTLEKTRACYREDRRGHQPVVPGRAEAEPHRHPAPGQRFGRKAADVVRLVQAPG